MNKLFLAFMLTGSLILTGCSSTEVSAPVVDTPTEVVQEQPTQFSIGETVIYNDTVEFTIEGVSEVQPNQLTKLNEGEKLVAIDLVVTNNSSETYTFSSLLCLEAIDIEGYSAPIEMFSSAKKPVDGGIPVGVTKKGQQVFKTTSDLDVVIIKPELGGESVVYNLN